MLVRVNGLRLVGDDVGQGQPVLFVHAFPLNRRMWAPQVEALAGDYRCLSVDLRGFGESDTVDEPYGLDEMASDLVGVLDALQLEKVTMVGLSMGGYIAFAFWRRYADRLRALVLADTRAGADNEATKTSREALAQQAESEGMAPVVTAQLPRLLSPAASPELRQWVSDMMEESAPQGVAAALRAMAARPDRSAMLPEVACPALVIAGADDIVTPAQEMAAMAQQLPLATYRLLTGAGHLANLEAPDAFNAALRSFLLGLS